MPADHGDREPGSEDRGGLDEATRSAVRAGRRGHPLPLAPSAAGSPATMSRRRRRGRPRGRRTGFRPWRRAPAAAVTPDAPSSLSWRPTSASSEPAQLKPLDVRSTVQVGQRRGQRAVRVRVAQRGHQQQRRVRSAVGEVAQHEQGRLVGPVDVVEHHQQRPPAGGGQDRGCGGGDGAEAIVRRLGVGRRWTSVAPSACSTSPPRPEGRSALGVDAAPPGHGGGRFLSARKHGELLGETGLTDTRLAYDEHEPSLARTGRAQPGTQCVQLAGAAEEQRPGVPSRRRHVGQHAPTRARCVGRAHPHFGADSPDTY